MSLASAPQLTIFDKDGISVTVIDLSASKQSNKDDDDSNIEGIVITLFLHRHHEKNVINPTMISALTQALDAIETHPMLAETHNKSLIITGLSLQGGNDKFFSNGLDLEWMMKSGNSKPGTSAPESEANNGNNVTIEERGYSSNPSSQMLERFCAQVLARILVLPLRTIAAIQGHCIGAGLFIALACDHRIMRTQRGFLQWPEARLGMRLSKGFAELTKAKVTDPKIIREGVLMAKRYTSSEALERGIIDGEYPMEELYGQALKLAVDGFPESPLLKLDYFDPDGFKMMKIELYTDAYRALKFGRLNDLPHSRI